MPTTLNLTPEQHKTLHARIVAALARTGHVASDSLDAVARVALDAVAAGGGFGALRNE
jgi:hypothetical protein